MERERQAMRPPGPLTVRELLEMLSTYETPDDLVAVAIYGRGRVLASGVYQSQTLTGDPITDALAETYLEIRGGENAHG